MSNQTSGKFQWHELWTLDAAASSHFYTQIFPWTSELFNSSNGYTIFSGKSGPHAGCYPLEADAVAHGAKPGWNTYVGSGDVDATAQLAAKHGARVLVPGTDIPGVGRFAMLADPQGAVFGLLRSDNPTPRPMPPPPGAVVWNELLTSDAEAALKFYSQLFGWKLINSIDMGPMGAYLVFGLNGEQMGGMMKAEIPGGPKWLPYTEVESTDALVDVAVKAGAKLCLGPQTVPGGGRIANFLDPHGVMFAVHSMSKEAAAASTAKPKAAAKQKTASKPAAAKPAAAKPAAAKRAKPKAKAKAKAKSKRKPAAKAKPRSGAAARRGKSAKRKVAKKSARRAAPRKAKSKAKAKAKRTPRRARRR